MAARRRIWTPDLVRGRWFVYRVHSKGECIYVGKGTGSRHLVSARRLWGIAGIVGFFDRERQALKYEKQLIAELRPPLNKTKGGEGRSYIYRKSDKAIEAGWRREAYARENSGFWLDKLIAMCYRKCEENDLMKQAVR